MFCILSSLLQTKPKQFEEVRENVADIRVLILQAGIYGSDNRRIDESRNFPNLSLYFHWACSPYLICCLTARVLRDIGLRIYVIHGRK